jgi:hypothetical protein
MDFSYTASGKVNVGGCAPYELDVYIYYRFAIGSVVYSKPKARKGVFEKVVIKNVRFPRRFDPTRTRMGYRSDLSPLYIDTLNGLFNEWDLVSYSDAVSIVAAYEEAKESQLQKLALDCNRAIM